MTRAKKPFVPASREKSCGKNRYTSRTEAEKIAHEQELIFANKDLHLEVYFCANCGGWHLTSRKNTA